MKSGIGSDTTKSAKNLAQAIARQMAQEPLEVLKTAKEQTTGAETAPKSSEAGGQPASAPEQQKQISEQQKIQDKMKSERRMEALNREIEDIRKADVFKDLQSRISAGEQIMLEEYPELTREQREVLAAQMQAVRGQIAAQQAQGAEALQMPVSKRGRKFGSSQKQEAEKQQTRVEKPVPPSG